MRRGNDIFQSVRTEGAILPAELLQRIVDGDRDVPGLRPEDYHLAKSERLNEAATRAWNRLQGAWESFKDSMEALPETNTGTTLTRERWMLILFQELGYGRLTTHKTFEIESKAYPISHFWQNTPIHLVSFRQDLDKRTPGRAGAARISPHSLVQEFLNRSQEHLWGFISNGLMLRLLRDNVSLTRQAFVEFDLQSMMDSEAYSDFFLLYLLCHQSRVEVPEGKTVEHCWLERWYNTAAQQGIRALDQLRSGVQNAIEVLGGGFLAHQANGHLRGKLRSGQLSTQDYYRQVLRQVYRLLFLFVAEDRGLLFDPDSSSEAMNLYTEYYSTQRLRKLASKTRGTRHPDLWRAHRLVFSKLYGGCPQLALPALGSFLFSSDATSDLNELDISNSDLLKAIRFLSFTVDSSARHPVNYRNLGPEELGSVYESLLEMHPEIHIGAHAFKLNVSVGSERKTTGSYYTPTSLVNCLLDSALNPVIDEAVKKLDPEEALLDLKICDPACGSGHFLLAAAHRVAKRLAAVRAEEEEPAPEATRQALRDVIGHCIYGVDVNPMSVELCKISLWLEALEPGKPLAFLDHHIKRGNSLLGTTPALLGKGIPDEAFKPIEGDDLEYCRELKKQNKIERKEFEEKQGSLFYPWERLGDLSAAMVNIDDMPDDTSDAVQRKQASYESHVRSSGYLFGHLWADAWCAAFVWTKVRERDGGLPYPITERYFRAIERSPHNVSQWVKDEIKRLAEKYSFFHWHLEFPDVFRVPKSDEETENGQTGWSGGFDCVLGNPPWERIKLQEKEFFAARNPEIANAPNAAERRRMIAEWKQTDPVLYQAFQEALRRADGESRLIRNTSRYPLCGRGDVNTYSIFAELKRSLLNLSGRVGCIVPSGIATDDTTKFFFQSLMDRGSLVSLYSFENEEFIFPAVHHATKFCLLTMAAPGLEGSVDFVFFARQVEHLSDKERHFTLTAEDIALLNPNTRTCPIFRYKRDAELTKYVYRRVPVLIREDRENQPEENPWGISFATMFHMANDSGLFRTREHLEAQGFSLNGNVFTRGEDVYLPLYEGKMFWHFDHRFGTYEGQTEAQANQGKLPELTPEQHVDPDFLSLPRYWVAEKDVEARVPKRPEMLASALTLPEQRRNEAVIKTFCYWTAGYWRKAGNEELAKKLLAIALRPSATDGRIDALDRCFLEGQCEKMQERFPITESDVKRMTTFSANPIPLAEELLKRFSPHWFVAFRDVTSAVVLRTAVFSILPRVAVGHKAPLALTECEPLETCCFLASMNSFMLDYIARQSVGGSSMSYFILKQLPVVPPETYSVPPPWNDKINLCTWTSTRVLELSQTAWDMDSLSEDCKCSWPPFAWDEERRSLIRSELDAAFFHIYLGDEEEWKQKGSKELLAYFPTPRLAIEYIMDNFRILRKREESTHGTYRTKDTILEIYDEMARVLGENAAAVTAGRQPMARFQTRLNPTPGPPIDTAGNFIPKVRWDQSSWPRHIHKPREAVVEQPEEVTVATFASMAYPATDADKAICAAALEVVEQSKGLSSMEHLDVLLLATHPNWCKAFLNQNDQPAFDIAMRSAPSALFVGANQSIRWKDCRDYLEKLDALMVEHGRPGQPIGRGTALASAKVNFPQGMDATVSYALKALERIRELRQDLSSVSQAQQNILDIFTQQHQLYELAA
jgi:hypothetical protein